MNRVVLVGRLTRDPDLRYTANGVAVANFNIAVNRPFTNQQGGRDADFINCVVWRRPAENLANYMKKGNLIGVDGRIQTRSYENKEGQMVYVTEVVADSVQFLESRNQAQGQAQPDTAGFGGQNPFGGSMNEGFAQGGSMGSSQAGPNRFPDQNQDEEDDDDPFKTSGELFDVSDDDLPF